MKSYLFTFDDGLNINNIIYDGTNFGFPRKKMIFNSKAEATKIN